MKSHPVAEFIALAAIWGSSFLFMRVGAAEFGPLATAGVRVAIGAITLVPILWFSGLWPVLRMHAAKILVIGVISSGVPFVLFSYAVMSISTGMSSILNATAPLFGALIAWWWLHDRPDRSRILGLVIGFAGVVLLASGKASFNGGGSGWAVLACLGATLCYGLAVNFTKRYLSGVHPLAIATGSQIGATLGLVLPTWWYWPAHNPGTGAWLSLVALGVLCSAVAYILYFRLIHQIGPARTITVTFLIPVFAVFFGVVFLDEALTGSMLACGVVIVIGTALSTGVLRLPAKVAQGV
ncbi:MAG: DMT family transporter [Rhodoferax sp.]|nr:DMT family transporter [Rhodoferax sp.]MBP9930765.1 DMT family transporter [Rhodoferax sp.]HQX58104.1 DMT family transporter [Burkholderiaceae bacterium]HQZ04402.1 DMT family transporter [Burkholderiaceae bacterium]HRA62887.1 DMT family transporter [Burkholderiaceae bacterium]